MKSWRLQRLRASNGLALLGFAGAPRSSRTASVWGARCLWRWGLGSGERERRLEERERERERQEGTSGDFGVALRAAIHQGVEGGMIKRAWRWLIAAPPLTASAELRPPPLQGGGSTAYGGRRGLRPRPRPASQAASPQASASPTAPGGRGRRRGGRIARFRPAGCFLSIRFFRT